MKFTFVIVLLLFNSTYSLLWTTAPVENKKNEKQVSFLSLSLVIVFSEVPWQYGCRDKPEV